MQTFEILAVDFFAWRKKLLSQGGRAADFDWLLDMQGGLSWSSLQLLYLNPEELVVLEESLEKLAILWQRHIDCLIPVQYLVGRCPWRDFELEVTPAALIPRQDSELLIDHALNLFRNKEKGRWADLGTGSGVLALALAKAMPSWIGHAVDCSSEALALAKRNIKKLGIKSTINLHLGNWWEPLKPWWGSFDFVLSNPPYIPSSLLKELDPLVKNNEPLIALSGGPDGLKSCREVISGARQGLKEGGWLILEHHHDQSEDVLEIMSQSGFKNVGYENDLQGIRRFAKGRKSQKTSYEN